MKALSSNEAYEYMKNLLSLPDSATSITINLRVGELATVDVEYTAGIELDGPLKARYKLVPLE